MKTKVMHISPQVVEAGKTQEIVRILQGDGVIVYPTETYYGLGANGFSTEAIKKIYFLKRRQPQKPLSVVISDFMMLGRIISGNSLYFRRMISDLWPGPLTIIFKASPAMPDDLCGKDRTIGVRMTEHAWVRALVRLAGFPITATSANISGERPVSDPEEAMKLFKGKVEIFVDGGRTEGLLPSTVVDLSSGKPCLVREGAVPFTLLKKRWPLLSGKPS